MARGLGGYTGQSSQRGGESIGNDGEDASDRASIQGRREQGIGSRPRAALTNNPVERDVDPIGWDEEDRVERPDGGTRARARGRGSRGGRSSRGGTTSQGGRSARGTPILSSNTIPESPGSQSSVDQPVQRRLYIDGKIMFPLDVASTITKSFALEFVAEGTSWGKVPAKTKRVYWEEFQKHYYWDSAIDEMVKTAYKSKANDRYKDLMYSLRHGKVKKQDGLSDEVWNKWRQFWGMDAYKTIQGIAQINRAEGCSHTGGSIPHLAHANRMKDENNGKAPKAHAVFKHVHIKRGLEGQPFVDKKAEELEAAFQRKLAEQQSQYEIGESSSLQPCDEDAIYYDVSNGYKKKRILGLGSAAPIIYPSCVASNLDHTSQTYEAEHERRLAEREREVAQSAREQAEIARINAEATAVIKQQQEEFRQAQEKFQQEQEKIRNEQRQLEERMEERMRTLLGPQYIAPPSRADQRGPMEEDPSQENTDIP